MMKPVLLTAVSIFILAGLIFIFSTKNAAYKATRVSYQIPEVQLLNQLAKPVNLREFFSRDQAIILNFSFTSCTTLCASESVLFTNLQKRFSDSTQVHLVSITIDPEVDRPEVLLKYLKQYKAKPGWDYLTGSKTDIQLVMDAFSYKPGDMFTFKSAFLLRAANSKNWIRIDGPIDTQNLFREYKKLGMEG